MSSAELVAQCATLSAALAALGTLVRSGQWRVSLGLTAFLAISAACDGAMVFAPGFWSAEFWSAREAAMALACAIGALELGHGVLGAAERLWHALCRRLLVVLALPAALGVFGLMSLGGPRAGYRGLLAADAAAACVVGLVLSAVSLYELPRHPLVVTTLRGLLAYLACEIVYLGSWEASRTLAHAMAWPATGAFVWAMLAIAHTAMASTGRAAPAEASR